MRKKLCIYSTDHTQTSETSTYGTNKHNHLIQYSNKFNMFIVHSCTVAIVYNPWYNPKYAYIVQCNY